MVAWLAAYDTELKQRVRLGGAPRGALDDPEVRKIVHANEMPASCLPFLRKLAFFSTAMLELFVSRMACKPQLIGLANS
jgi:hypothetical protein